MVKPPMDARDAPRRPTAGSEPPTQPRRVIIGNEPKKRPSIFTQFKVDKGSVGNKLPMSAVFLFLALSYTGLVLFFAWLGGGLIIESPSLHQHAIPHICARGYEI